MRAALSSSLVGVVFLLSHCVDISPSSAQTALEKLEKTVRKQVGLSDAPPPPAPNDQPGHTETVEDPGKPGQLENPETRGADSLSSRGYLGAVVDDRKDRGRGVRVQRLIPGGPAEKAGLKAGDLITGLGGIRVRQMSDFASIAEQTNPGESLTFEIIRGESREKLDVVFGPRAAGRKAGQPTPAQMPEKAPPHGTPRAPSLAVGTAAAPAVPAAEPPPPTNPSAAPKDDRSRVEVLERRMEQLERRLEALERALRKEPVPPAK
jgi:hypothetical protein